jgi:hypothetical protein
VHHTHIVRVNSIATLVCSLLNALLHDVKHGRAAHVDIVLAFPSVKTGANVGLGKVFEVWTPVFRRPCRVVTENLFKTISILVF